MQHYLQPSTIFTSKRSTRMRYMHSLQMTLLLRHLLPVALVVSAPYAAHAQQAPEIDWQRCYGGSAFEEGHAVVQTSDGGYAIAGARENGSNGWDYFVVKVDASGNPEWQRMYGGSAEDKAYGLKQTPDGGYIVVGYARSNNGDVTGNNGQADCWVVKLDASGDIEWQRALGGPGFDAGYDVILTTDAGYLITAWADQAGGDVSEHYGSADFWIVRLYVDGSIEWERSFGGSGTDLLRAAVATSDGGYLIVGATESADGHITDPLGGWDMWVLKLDPNGELQWQRTYGGSGGDGAGDVVLVSAGGYLIAGSTSSTDGDVSESFGNDDLWLVRVDAMGELLWERSYGGSSVEWSNGIVAVANGYVMAGSTSSSDGDITGYQGGFYDYWLIRVDLEGELIWQRCLGGPGDDRAGALDTTADGGYIVAGLSNSNGGDVTSLFPGYDIWVVKLDADPTMIEEVSGLSNLSVFPVPSMSDVTLDFSLESAARVSVQLMNMAGQQTRQLLDAKLSAGEQRLTWSMADLPSGLYALRITVGGQVHMHKLVKQ